MARGNQRDKAREANLKKQAGMVSNSCTPWRLARYLTPATHWSRSFALDVCANPPLQKKANTKTGAEMQRDRDALAQKMREKQAAGTSLMPLFRSLWTLQLRSTASTLVVG
jgi:hypothetical protein